MGGIKLEYQMHEVQGRYKHLSLPFSDFKKFNENILGLGDIAKQGERLDALAAIFDLEGFTSFCNQIDPHLVVPEYMNKLLQWLFEEISSRFKKETLSDKVIMWGKFPCFAKFLGDGILFLWDTKGLGQASMGNIIINLYRICESYINNLIPVLAGDFVKVPSKLRCGIARGQVIPIGGGKDFVGPCINLAARLQKVSQLSFAFPRKGFDPEKCFSETWKTQFVQKKIAIRGLEEEELIFICKKEFETLPPEEKQFFKNP